MLPDAPPLCPGAEAVPWVSAAAPELLELGACRLPAPPQRGGPGAPVGSTSCLERP